MSHPPARAEGEPSEPTRQLEHELARENTELEKSLAVMRGVLDAVTDAILVIDESGRVAKLNRKLLALWNVPEPLRRSLESGCDASLLLEHELGLVTGPERHAARVKRLYSDERSVATDQIELVDGRAISRYTAPVRTSDGKVRGRLWCFRDVTDARKLAARRAVVSERLASVGQLVGSVAHEINNPLAYIAGNLDYVADALRAGARTHEDELLEAIEDARTGVERIKVIVRDLRALARVDEDTREPMDVRPVLETALQMANNELRHRARVIRDLRPVPAVSANAGRLTQVFLNLLMNAAQAIPDGRASENTVTVATSTSPLGGACIEIRDTGTGIAPDLVERIFDPFFTTKPIGAGPGLGLTICKGIIETLGGTIEVESREGAGTTVIVELPPAAPLAGRAPGTSTPPASRAARRSILVIDDDVHIRRWFQRLLPAHDLTVVPTVTLAEQAIESRSFDVVLCDVMMPDRTGMDLHASLARRHPELVGRLIFMSGGVFTPALSTFVETVSNPCLRKPFGKKELEEAIAKVLLDFASNATGEPSA